jgi:hypothetical protein
MKREEAAAQAQARCWLIRSQGFGGIGMVSDTELTLLVVLLQPFTFRRGDTIVECGTKPERLLFVEEGEAFNPIVQSGQSAPSDAATEAAPAANDRTIVLASELVGAGLLLDDQYDTYLHTSTLVAASLVRGYALKRADARRLIRQRSVLVAVEQYHQLREQTIGRTIDAPAAPVRQKAMGGGISRREKPPSPSPPEADQSPFSASADDIGTRALRLRYLPEAASNAESKRARWPRPSSAASLSLQRDGPLNAHRSAFRVHNDFLARSDGVLRAQSHCRFVALYYRSSTS